MFLVGPPQGWDGVARAGDFHILGPGGILGPGLALKPPWAFMIILALFAAEGMVEDLSITPAGAPLKLESGS